MSFLSFQIDKSRILYEDRDLLLYQKPAGLAVESARVSQTDLESLLKSYLPESAELSVITRLDQPVEGLVLFAKNKKTAAALSGQLADGTIRKQYLAVCCVKEPADIAAYEQNPVRVVHYLKKDGRTNTSAAVAEHTPGAKKAELDLYIQKTWRADAGNKEPVLALAEIGLITGRHHQIRVQMAALGLPLFGDRKYNSDWEMYAGSESRNLPLCLCACRLSFRHPGKKQRMEFEISPDWLSLIPCP